MATLLELLGKSSSTDTTPMPQSNQNSLMDKLRASGSPDGRQTYSPNIPPEKKTIGGFFGNILSSAGKLGTGLLKSIYDPITAGTAIGRTALGGIEESVSKTPLLGIGPLGVKGPVLQDENTKQFDAFMGNLKERYGSPQKFLDTLYSDPAGVALDASVFLEGIGAIGKGTKVGEITAKAGEAVDPLKVSGKIAKGSVKTVGRGGETLLGLTTRRGVGTIREAFGAGEAGGEAQSVFRAGMRGKTTEAEVVGRSQGALGKIVESRSAEFKSSLNALKQANPQSLDITPILDKEKSLMEDYGIKSDASGNLDFSRSPLIGDQNKVKAMISLVEDYGSKVGDRTLTGIDTLKRNLRNFRETNNPVLNRFVDQLADSAKNILVDNVKGYSAMEAKYAAQSDTIRQIQKDLALSDKVSIDRAFKTLTNAVKKDSELKTGLMRELENAGAQNLIKEIAGVNLSDILPDDVFRVSMDIGAMFSVLAGVSPDLLLGVLTTSPRVAGELVNALGVGTRVANKVVGILNRYRVLDAAGYFAKAGVITQRGLLGFGEIPQNNKTTTPFIVGNGQP